MDASPVSAYPDNVPRTIPDLRFQTLPDLLNDAFTRHESRIAYRSLGSRLTFGETQRSACAFAAYLQGLGLEKGDRVALMMPNILQYPIAIAGVLFGGFVVVNVNPLYTSRELEQQLRDAGARAIVIFEGMAQTLARCIDRTGIRHVVLAGVGDMFGWPKGWLVNAAIRHVRRMVPPYDLPEAIRWNQALAIGARGHPVAPDLRPDDVAVLQYTGGTTGIAKGAMLTHRNIVANAIQSELWHRPVIDRIPSNEQVVTVCALPLYHIFGFTANMMLSLLVGGCSILIVNPRDIPALLKELRRGRFHCFPAVNTLFDAIARHPQARSVDWSHLKLSVGGGMMVQRATAERWKALTGTTVCEGYGLSETSPVVSCNPVLATDYTGTIGLPLPSTEMRVIDDDERPVAPGDSGEIAVRGPQVMRGYWRRPDETAAAMTADGFFKTGDIGIREPDGSFRIVDRKKDMINVSGFNVYPNEIEDLIMRMPGIVEAAAIGVPDQVSGEAVKLVLVRADDTVDEAAVKAFCRANLTGYKRPKQVEFRAELPKTAVGKVLRRALRAAP